MFLSKNALLFELLQLLPNLSYQANLFAGPPKALPTMPSAADGDVCAPPPAPKAVTRLLPPVADERRANSCSSSGESRNESSSFVDAGEAVACDFFASLLMGEN
jgi:hypothetical protein